MIKRAIAVFCAGFLPAGMLAACTQTAVPQQMAEPEYTSQDIGCSEEPPADDADDENDLFSTTLEIICV